MLSDIKSPVELRKMDITQLEALAAEIREKIIAVTLKNGGHLSSNLGTVELTMALHYVFDTPIDKLIWDVGHQCYTHKLLTGRCAEFDTLRCEGGLSGFPKKSESGYDVFDTGHSSTAISSALGLARARDCQGQNYHVVAVVGDGAMGGGMAFEALNDAGDRKHRLIIVLNDNEMSISRNVGAMSVHLNKLRTARTYLRSKRVIEKSLKIFPGSGTKIKHMLERMKNAFKYLIMGHTLFDTLGIKYIGPIDGHSLRDLIDILERAKAENVPVLVHTVTKKGKGYLPAELDPTKYHGISPAGSKKTIKKTFSETFGDTLCTLVAADPCVCAVTAGMTTGTGLANFSVEYPDHFFDAGIAEQHALTMAAGLAAGGMRPFVALYCSFLQRGLDQLFQDICLQGLPVKVCIDRAGLTGEDGETHQGIYDIGYLRAMPHLVIMAPRDQQALSDMLTYALTLDAPVAIRYPRGGSIETKGTIALACGCWDVIREGADGTLIAFGACLQNALLAADILQECGRHYGVADARFLKPLDHRMLDMLGNRPLAIIEDNAAPGGLGEAIAAYYADHDQKVSLQFFTLGDQAVQHAAVSRQQQCFGIDAVTIAEKILKN